MNNSVVKALCRLVVVAVMIAPLASAHHSTSMFDMAKDVTIEGTIKDFQWTNPHSWLLLAVIGQDGNAMVWSFEAGPPSVLTQMGLKKSQFVAGENVQVHMHPMKEGGKPAGFLISVIRADGTVINTAGVSPAKP